MRSRKAAVSELRASLEGGAENTRRFVDWAGKQAGTPQETRTNDLIDDLRLNAADGRDLVNGIKILGLATFVVGRRGAPSRLRWLYTLSSIADVARRKRDEFEPVGALSEPSSETKLIKYVFQLRRNLKIELPLPVDLTPQDVERLSAYQKTLPIEEE